MTVATPTMVPARRGHRQTQVVEARDEGYDESSTARRRIAMIRRMLTVADVIALPELRRGRPEVVAGDRNLDRAVRWAHVLDLAEVHGLLDGGEFVLCNGFGIGSEPRVQRAFIRELSEQGAAAVAVELGILYRGTLPSAMVDESRRTELPLIALHRKTRFVEVTEAVLRRVMDDDYAQLRRAEELSRTLNDAVLGGADLATLLDEVSRAADLPVLLEDDSGRVLGIASFGARDEEILRTWEEMRRTERRDEHLPRGVHAAPVQMSRRTGGRLLALEVDSAGSAFTPIALERGAEAVALRIATREREDELLAGSRGELLAGLARGERDGEESARMAKALGFAPDGQMLPFAACRRQQGQAADWAVLAGTLQQAFARAGMPAIIGPRGAVALAIVDAGLHGDWNRAATEVAAVWEDALRRRGVGPAEVVLAAGSLVTDWTAAGVALERAERRAVAATAEAADGVHDARRMRLDDVLHAIDDLPAVQGLIDDWLGPLLRQSEERSIRELRDTLRAYLRHSGKKSRAARDLHIERQSLYYRLERLQSLLELDLEDGETLATLHLALRAIDRREGVSA
jgi:purine catabolism regulator